MNVDNIAALSAMLIRAGFEEGIGYRILQRVCFNPVSFSLVERLQKKSDVLTCLLHFERNGSDYTCSYYDVSLLKGITMPDRIIAAVNLSELDQVMGEIDWYFKVVNQVFRLHEETSWQREKSITQIVHQLSRLSATEEGKYFADALRLKYWAEAGLEEVVGNVNAIRAKFEISQRVYFIEGEGISVDEAYRFLLNRWMEKKMQARRRERDRENQSDNSDSNGEVSGKGLLQKKKRTRVKRNNR